MRKKGLTLMELLAVIVIVGVLATLGLGQYRLYKERELDKEAQANLRLITGAEKIYRMEAGSYYPYIGGTVDNMASINTDLGLLLPTGSGRAWNYLTIATVSPAAFCAQATRNEDEDDARTHRIRNTEDDPVADAICP
ncbi:MAG: type II secretion system protein [Candidatus Omnitrophota bacterium]